MPDQMLAGHLMVTLACGSSFLLGGVQLISATVPREGTTAVQREVQTLGGGMAPLEPGHHTIPCCARIGR